MLNNPVLQCRSVRLRFEVIPVLGEVINSSLEEGNKMISPFLPGWEEANHNIFKKVKLKILSYKKTRKMKRNV